MSDITDSHSREATPTPRPHLGTLAGLAFILTTTAYLIGCYVDLLIYLGRTW